MSIDEDLYWVRKAVDVHTEHYADREHNARVWAALERVERLTKLGAQTEAVLEAENVRDQLCIESTNSWVGYSIIYKALRLLKDFREKNN